MVVDDEADVRSTVKAILEKKGYEVVAASSGDDCLKKLEEGEKPDLILLDIMMPGTPVKEVVPKIKGIKILYFTSVRMSDEEKKNLENAGNVVGFMQKPFDINEFVAKIKSLIG
jgi:CheY-like chemotaxis protein